MEPSEFVSLQSDITSIKSMGKIKDNSANKTPQIIFDTNKFGVYEHRMTKRTFRKLPLFDIENLAHTVPKDFKQVYLGDQTYLIAGG